MTISSWCLKSPGNHRPGAASATSIRSLDGLRGLAALIVYLSHVSNASGLLNPVLGGGEGQVGVMIFFVLSGFLMGYLYLGDKPDTRNVGRFLVRRFARVVPLYLVLVLASFLVIMLLPKGPHWVYPISSVDRLIEHLAMIRGRDVLWSVVAEIKFYLLVPLIWILYAKAPRATLLLLATVSLCAFAYQAWLGFPQNHGGRFIIYVPYFLGGLMIARCMVPRIASPAESGQRWNALFVAALVGVPLLYPKVAAYWMPFRIDVWGNPIALLFVSVLLIAAMRAPLADALLGSRPFRFLGRVSYGIYLLHMLVIVNIDHYSRLDHKPILYLLVSLPIVLLAAQAAYVLIEHPTRTAINRCLDRAAPRLARETGPG